jgi:hypothetical protein
MSTLKVNGIRGTGASADAITVNATDGTCTAKITNNLSNRNLIINGAMNVAQRASSSTSGGYTVMDRWQLNDNNTNVTITQSKHALTSSDTGPWAKGFRNSYSIALSAAGNSLSAASYCKLKYMVEAQDGACSGWDYTSASSYITLSFWFQCSTNQTFYGRLETDDGTAQNYPFSFTASGNNTWTKITKTIPGHANLTINNDNGVGLGLNFSLFSGADRTASGVALDTWAAYASGTRYPDQANTWLTAGASTFEMTGVQLEVGDTATEFEHRKFQDELYNCQRYYQQVGTTTQDGQFCIGASHLTSAGDQTRIGYFGQNNLRATPTITEFGNGLKVIGSGSNTDVTTIDDINVTFPSAYLQFNANCTDIGDDNEIVVVTNTANGGIQISAEL